MKAILTLIMAVVVLSSFAQERQRVDSAGRADSLSHFADSAGRVEVLGETVEVCGKREMAAGLD